MLIANLTCRIVAAVALACAASQPLLAETFAERMAPCLACHGEKGQSETEKVPSLGGQLAPYVLIQLFMFRENQRRSQIRKDDQMIEVMFDMTRGFSDDDLRTFSDFISKLPPPKPVEDVADAARIEKAKVLMQQHRCNFCHDVSLAGSETVPRIAAQREDFLIKTLHDYKTNYRNGYEATMADVVRPLSDDDVLNLAYYIARFR